ncbi:ABC transporter permease [Amycolatopsis sp. H20-H5]|uniref:ABC transporter permease n=1 Tax=Amycolatopsis sp. H20-H5 TaxID=3046309 RepID=UPI002DBD98C9|nr:FtsX-like permease family protein [Amycolatopsis sp. H20-H5]MEC3975635.1 FtsX-like permease family protein [Amycolatopsis sp. H20-H5]
MLRLAMRTLRLRKGGFLATFVAVFFGALIVAACGGLLETGIRAEAVPQRLAGAPIVVSGEQTYLMPRNDPESDSKHRQKTENATLPERVRLDGGLVGKLGAVPGVAGAVGEVNFAAGLMRDGRPVSGDSLGHGWDSAALTPFALTAGGAPSVGEVVLADGLAREAGVRVGDRVEVAAHGGVEGFRVAGVASAAQPVARGSVFFAAGDADRLSGRPGLVDTIGLFVSPGADLAGVESRVSDALRGTSATVSSGNDRAATEFPEAVASGENLIVLAAVSGGLAAMVAMFVVASTLTLSVQQRRRELALLRAVGTTPRQLRRMVLGEAMVVAVLATGLAGVLGPLLGHWLFDQLVSNRVVPSVVRFHQGWIPSVAAAGAAILAALVAAITAGLRAGRVRPTEALADAAMSKRWLTPVRLIVAVLAFGGGTALAIVTVAVMTGPVAASTAGPAVILWAVGLAMISPGVTKVMAAILQWPVRALSGVNGRLAMLNTRAGVVRVAGAVTPIMLAVGIATGNIYLQTTSQAVSDQAFSQDLRADAVVGSVAGGLAPDLVSRVQSVPGVRSASEYVTSTAFIQAPFDSGQNDDGWPVVGLTASGAAQATADKATQGRLDALSGDTVALPETIAADLGRRVGDTVTLRLGDGAVVDVRVVALTTGRPGFASLLLPADLLAPHTTSGLAPQLLVNAAPGIDAATLTGRLREVAAGLPGVVVGDRSVLVAAHKKKQDVGVWVNYLMVGMIMAYTVISVVNTLVMATARRRREFGLQRLTGSTRAQVLRMAGIEGGVVATIGIAAGTVVAAGSIVPFCLVASDSLLPSGPIGIYLAVIGAAAALALVATLVPTWAATRGRAVDAATIED